ncbi:MAG: chemotaxis protein CheW [Desulfomonilia bacterium]|nr:chemotaxis protein CheW [Desulfomonilia bacterium]
MIEVGEFDDLICEFVTESKEHIADIEEDLISIEADRQRIDPDVINRVFRAAHSIKGSARFLELNTIGELAHKMEDVLNLIRSGKLLPTNTVSTPLLQAADMLKVMFDTVTESNDMDITEHLGALQAILDGTELAERQPSAPGMMAGEQDLLTVFDVDSATIESSLRSSNLYVLGAIPGDKDIGAFMSELGQLGEVLGFTEHQSGSPCLLFSTIMEPDLIPFALGIPPDSITQIERPPAQTEDNSCTQKPVHTPPWAANPQKRTDLLPRDEELPQGHDTPCDDTPPEVRPMPEEERKNNPAPIECPSFITFTLDKEIYAVPITSVEEIIGQHEMSLLPNVPDFIKGVINLRGELIPIMDLRIKFGLPRKAPDQPAVFLILRVEEKIVGTIVDTVSDVLTIHPKKIQKRPSFASTIYKDFIEGVYKDQEDMVILVSVPDLIRPDEWFLGQGLTRGPSSPTVQTN